MGLFPDIRKQAVGGQVPQHRCRRLPEHITLGIG